MDPGQTDDLLEKDSPRPLYFLASLLPSYFCVFHNAVGNRDKRNLWGNLDHGIKEGKNPFKMPCAIPLAHAGGGRGRPAWKPEKQKPA